MRLISPGASVKRAGDEQPLWRETKSRAQFSWCESPSRTSLTSLCCREATGESPLVRLRVTCVNSLLSLSTHCAWVCVCSVSKMELFKHGYSATALSSEQPVLRGTPACLRSALQSHLQPRDRRGVPWCADTRAT